MCHEKRGKRVSMAWTWVVVALAATRFASADPVAVVGVDSTLPAAADQGLKTCHVSVQFAEPYQTNDNVSAVSLSDISTDDPAGFYQVPAAMGGSNTSPLQLFVNLFPQLLYDSFVTVGTLVIPIGGSGGANVDPNFDSTAFNNAGQLTGGWYTADSSYQEGLPDENGRTVVAQLTIGQDYNVSGEFDVYLWPDGGPFHFSFDCFGSPCTGDLNGDGTVNAADLAMLLGAWGPNPAHAADLNGDDAVNAADLAMLLGNAGPCD